MTSPRSRSRVVLCVLGATFASLGLLLVLVTVTPVVYWWASVLSGPWEDPNGDVLIVLGGSLLDKGLMGQSSYWRSVYALRAWRQGTFQRMVISGGPADYSTAVPMSDFLEAHGVPREAIELETQSRSTRENAVRVAELLARVSGRKVLLTSDYHMFRAYHAFKKAGLDVLPRPFPDVRKRSVGWAGRWPAFLDVVLETIKIGYYQARGWI